MFRLIKEFIEFLKMKNERVMSCKKFVLTQAMIKFYEDLQKTKGSVELPPFICAQNEMSKLKSDRDINKLYRKFEMAGLI